MATYGVLPTGFYAKPLSVVEDEVDADLQEILGASAGTDLNGKIPLASKAGQLKTMMVTREAAVWDLLEAVHASVDPNKATGASQDAVASITGALREAKQYSSVTGTCSGTPLTVLTAGRVATVEDTGSRFASLTNATITALTAWAGTTAYVAGDRRTNAARTYQCITAGTSAGSGGPTTTAADITDGTVHWEYLGEGTGVVDVTFQAETAGEIGGLAGTLSTIATPVDGWKTVTNLLDVQVGNAQEVDSAFRARRDLELAAPGNTTVDAIRANILKVNEGSTDPDHAPPISCKVFYNDTDATNSDGLPPHSVEVMVQLESPVPAETLADIAQAVWDSVGGGTATYGTRSDPVVDSEGNTQTVNWTQPTEVPIYVTATGRYDSSAWPAGSELLVAQTMLSALLTFTEDWPIAKDPRTSPLNGAFMRGPAETDDEGAAVVPADPAASAVAGLLEVDPLYIGTSASPLTSTQIPITVRQIATFDSTRCVITAATEDP